MNKVIMFLMGLSLVACSQAQTKVEIEAESARGVCVTAGGMLDMSGKRVEVIGNVVKSIDADGNFVLLDIASCLLISVKPEKPVSHNDSPFLNRDFATRR